MCNPSPARHFPAYLDENSLTLRSPNRPWLTAKERLGSKITGRFRTCTSNYLAWQDWLTVTPNENSDWMFCLEHGAWNYIKAHPSAALAIKFGVGSFTISDTDVAAARLHLIGAGVDLTSVAVLAQGYNGVAGADAVGQNEDGSGKDGESATYPTGISPCNVFGDNLTLHFTACGGAGASGGNGSDAATGSNANGGNGGAASNGGDVSALGFFGNMRLFLNSGPGVSGAYNGLGGSGDGSGFMNWWW